MSNKKQQKLKELQKIWYNRLAESGFEDIEQEDGNLKQWHSTIFHRSLNRGKTLDMVLSGVSAKAEYFRLASQFLHEYAFTKPLHKLIWQYHSEGMPYRKIAELLGTLGIKKYPTQVQAVIYTVEKAMLEFYKKEVELERQQHESDEE